MVFRQIHDFLRSPATFGRRIGLGKDHVSTFEILDIRLSDRDGPDSPGLGLFVANTLVEAHGGRVDVQGAPEPGRRDRLQLIVMTVPGRAR